MMDSKIIDKVRALLAKAEASEFEAESIAFTAKATQLMVDNSIDQAMLAKAGEKLSESIVARPVVINGYAKAKAQLLLQIVDAFGAKAIQERNDRESGWATINATIIGWESDLDNIEMLFASLQMQMTNEMERSAKANKNVHGRAFKQAFILGFAIAVGDRLRAQRVSAVAVADDVTPGASLAVVERSTAVEADYRRRYPSVGRGVAAKASNLSGYADGKQAGNRANIGQASVSGGRKALSV